MHLRRFAYVISIFGSSPQKWGIFELILFSLPVINICTKSSAVQWILLLNSQFERWIFICKWCEKKTWRRSHTGTWYHYTVGAGIGYRWQSQVSSTWVKLDVLFLSHVNKASVMRLPKTKEAEVFCPLILCDVWTDERSKFSIGRLGLNQLWINYSDIHTCAW